MERSKTQPVYAGQSVGQARQNHSHHVGLLYGWHNLSPNKSSSFLVHPICHRKRRARLLKYHKLGRSLSDSNLAKHNVDHTRSHFCKSSTSRRSPLVASLSAQCGRTSRQLSRILECSLSVWLNMPPLPENRKNLVSTTKSVPTDVRSDCRDCKTGSPEIQVDKLNVPITFKEDPKAPSANPKNSTATEDVDKDTDSGYAWAILAIVFTINASTLGTARAYGLIYDKLAREDDLSRAQAAMPFTIMGAVENMAGPLSGYMLARTGSWRATVFVGCLMITTAHFLSAILDSHIGQLLSMGLMCGLGLSFVTISFFQINNAYFVRYRSTAFGLGLTGAAFGTLYISPLCQHTLDNYGTRTCYLMLGILLLPNVLLALLLKPKRVLPNPQLNSKRHSSSTSADSSSSARSSWSSSSKELATISGKLDNQKRKKIDIWQCIKRVVSTPMFHLIWPTQLLFCWFNFVFGMIIVDYGNDRNLTNNQVAHLVPIWAFGQLTGRMLLGSLVDLKFMSYRWFTIICFIFIGMTTWALNHVYLDEQYSCLVISVLLFALSMFIALLYILFNGLIVNYMEPEIQPLSIGISSFAGSFFLFPRASVIGYYRDTAGNYDGMLSLFAITSLIAAVMWLMMPPVFSKLGQFWAKLTNRHNNNQVLFNPRHSIA